MVLINSEIKRKVKVKGWVPQKTKLEGLDWHIQKLRDKFGQQIKLQRLDWSI
jgi:hypothetical protein